MGMRSAVVLCCAVAQLAGGFSPATPRAAGGARCVAGLDGRRTQVNALNTPEPERPENNLRGNAASVKESRHIQLR